MQIYCLYTGNYIKDITTHMKFITPVMNKHDVKPQPNEFISHMESYINPNNEAYYSNHIIFTNQRKIIITYINDSIFETNLNIEIL